jgi:hypothetical protein
MDRSKLSGTHLTPDQWEKAQASVALFWDTKPSQEIILKFLNNPQNMLLSAELDIDSQLIINVSE